MRSSASVDTERVATSPAQIRRYVYIYLLSSINTEKYTPTTSLRPLMRSLRGRGDRTVASLAAWTGLGLEHQNALTEGSVKAPAAAR
jgi:hypothetical protein